MHTIIGSLVLLAISIDRLNYGIAYTVFDSQTVWLWTALGWTSILTWEEGVKNEGLSLVDTDQGIKCSLLYMVMIKSVILDLQQRVKYQTFARGLINKFSTDLGWVGRPYRDL